MERCFDCNGIIAKGETACVSCGKPTDRKDEGAGFAPVLVKGVNLLLYTSTALTAAHLFFTFNPPFTKCGAATLVLGIVKSSAGQMLERKRA